MGLSQRWGQNSPLKRNGYFKRYGGGQEADENEEASLQLKPEEWKSGDILWLVHAAGETRFVRHVVDELTKKNFEGAPSC